MTYCNKQRGVAALTAVIILAIVLLVVGAGIGLTMYLDSASQFSARAKERSYSMAYSCFEYARYMISIDPNYPGGETYVVNDEECEISATQLEDKNGNDKKRGDYVHFETRAIIDGSTSHLDIVLDKFLAVYSFTEVSDPNFAL